MIRRASWTILALAVCCILHAPADAQTQAITVTHTYVMGDNDSRNEARRLCFLEAKRKVLEMAGSYIQSQTEIENLHLSKDKITAYSAAVLSVEVVKEEFSFSNGRSTLTLTVKADVDTADVKKRLEAIVADKSLQERIAAQQEQIRRLEEQVHQLNTQLNVAPIASSGELRKERNVVIGNIQELENKKMVAVQRITDEADRIRQNSERIRKYIVKMMTEKEVQEILGPPFRKEQGGHAWFYGELWVCFRQPLASGDERVWGAGYRSVEKSSGGPLEIYLDIVKYCKPNIK